MADRWQTQSLEFKGGLITNLSPYQHGIQAPGSARILRNFEPSVFGGYRRVEGFEKLGGTSTNIPVVPNSGLIRGVFKYAANIYACRGDGLFFCDGLAGTTSWTEATDNAAYSSAGVTIGGSGKVRFLKYNFDGTEKLMVVDGTGKPFRFDGTTFEQLTSLPADTSGATQIINFKNHVFLGVGNNLVYSAPYEDDDFSIANGGGVINIGDPITGLVVFREQLVIFSRSTINVLTGSSIADYVLQPVSRNLGCVAEDTIQEIGGDIIFLGPDGLRLFNATDKIGDFGLAVISKPIQTEMLDLISTSPSGFSSTVIREKSQYRIFGFNSTYGNSSAKGVVGTQLQEGIQWNDLRGFNAYVIYSEYDFGATGASEVVYFANGDGYVYQMEQGNTQDGAHINATFATPFITITDPEIRKTFYKGTTYLDVNGAFDLEFSLEFDFDQPNTVQPDSVLTTDSAASVTFGEGIYGTSLFGNKQKAIYEVQTIGSGFTVSILYETTGEGTDAVFSIDSATLEYAVNDRR